MFPMNRPFLIVLALIGLSATGVFGARLVGRASAGRQDAVSAMFTNPDGTPCQMPCLLGVRPGDMTARQAIRLILKHPLTSHLQVHAFSRETYLTGPGMMVTLYHATGDSLSGMIWSLYDGAGSGAASEQALHLGELTTAEVVSTLGAPSSLELLRLVGKMAPVYIYFDGQMGVRPHEELSTTGPDARLQTGAPINWFSVWEAHTVREKTRWEVGWRGFTTLDHYIAGDAGPGN